MRQIKTFETKKKGIIPKLPIKQDPSGHFVRDADRLRSRVVTLLAEVLEERYHRKPAPGSVATWDRQIKLLQMLLIGPIPPIKRIFDVVTWYRDHWSDSIYIPHIASAQALRQKWDSLETAYNQRVSTSRSVEQVLQSADVPGPLADNFMDLLLPAKALHLYDVKSDGALAQKLITLFYAIRDERNRADLSSDWKIRLGGPYAILRRYIDWLSEQEWRNPSSQVLDPKSKSFAQWRRHCALLENRDPITGKWRS